MAHGSEHVPVVGNAEGEEPPQGTARSCATGTSLKEEGHTSMRFLLRLIATAAALWLAVQLVPGIIWGGSTLGLLGVALVFGVLNALVRPLLILLSCPLIILTLGLFLLVLNAVMLLLTAAVSRSLGLGFVVEGFFPAFLGALVVAVTSAVLNVFVGEPRKRQA